MWITSFDRTEKIETEVLRPDRYHELFKELEGFNVISRGSGLNYSMASGSHGGRSVLSEKFNRFLHFDQERKLVRVEPGVTLGELYNFSILHDLLPPVLAGYPDITVGGAVAMNIHGKNHYKKGNFGEHIHQLNLYHPRYGEIICSPIKNTEVFWLTVGGFGLTGHIISVDIALQPLASKAVLVEKHKVDCLEEAAKLLQDASDKTDYSYSWHNLNKSNNKFGQGIVYLEQHKKELNKVFPSSQKRSRINPNKSTHWSILNGFNIPLMCKLYYRKETWAQKKKIVDLYSALFPIVSKEMYFKMFGKSGFREYQALIPTEKWKKFTQELKNVIEESYSPISLASLKIFKGSRKYLNFSGEGISLAIDIPNDDRSLDLFGKIDEIVAKNHGIANIAKDSRLNSQIAHKMYGDQYQEFRKELRKFDPETHFQSELRKRLDV